MYYKCTLFKSIKDTQAPQIHQLILRKKKKKEFLVYFIMSCLNHLSSRCDEQGSLLLVALYNVCPSMLIQALQSILHMLIHFCLYFWDEVLSLYSMFIFRLLPSSRFMKPGDVRKVVRDMVTSLADIINQVYA